MQFSHFYFIFLTKEIKYLIKIGGEAINKEQEFLKENIKNNEILIEKKVTNNKGILSSTSIILKIMYLIIICIFTIILLFSILNYFCKNLKTKNLIIKFNTVGQYCNTYNFNH